MENELSQLPNYYRVNGGKYLALNGKIQFFVIFSDQTFEGRSFKMTMTKALTKVIAQIVAQKIFSNHLVT
ncbi:hypothetical protein [Ruegeria sp. HKCCA5463]|uniref:hypothetical protein n=1 Tax=Ruegeria sp. HKCCA5463 TaxID=2682994 RepID=UPI001C2C32DD|nr:hypothetical protein [Ruegeria sp. HKCCA5463]